MNSSARYLLAAAAAIIVVAVGVAMLRPGGGFGGVATPTPVLSLTPTVPGTATPAPTPAERHLTASTFAAPFTITIPSAWSGDVGPTHRVGFYTGSPATGFWGVSIYAGVRLYADPCHPSSGFTAAGEFATPTDLVAGLQAVPGLTVSDATAYQSPGHAGLRVDFQYTGVDTGCELPDRGVLVYATNLSDHDLGINTGYRQRWFITSVKGSVIVIEAWGGSVPLADKMAQLQPIVDSITFE